MAPRYKVIYFDIDGTLVDYEADACHAFGKARDHAAESHPELAQCLTDETFKRSDKLLDRAQKALEGAPEKYARRLAFVRAGCEFLRLQTENRALVSALRKAGDEADAKDLARARSNWKAMHELARKHPSFWHGGYCGHLRPVADPDYEEK